MPGPPPPPPAPMGPPPPPIGGMSPMKKSGSSGAPPDMRGALLGQIQKGTKLKKVTTVDKSGPAVAGRIAGESTSASSSPMKSSRGPTTTTATSNKSSPDSSTSSPASSRPPGGFASLTDELAYKLTMKKNKQSPVKETTKEVRERKTHSEINRHAAALVQ